MVDPVRLGARGWWILFEPEVHLGDDARAEVRDAWLVDPLARTLEVYRLEAGRWVVVGAHGGDDTLRDVEPFGGVSIDLARWWIEATAEAAG